MIASGHDDLNAAGFVLKPLLYLVDHCRAASSQFGKDHERGFPSIRPAKDIEQAIPLSLSILRADVEESKAVAG